MERSADWLKQAIRDLERAQLDMKYAFYEWACFTAQQGAVKAVYQKMNLSVRGQMMEGLENAIEVSEGLLHLARILDRYYIESRYPNGFPAGSPFEYFDEKIAKEAYDAAREILGFCEDYISRS